MRNPSSTISSRAALVLTLISSLTACAVGSHHAEVAQAAPEPSSPASSSQSSEERALSGELDATAEAAVASFAEAERSLLGWVDADDESSVSTFAQAPVDDSTGRAAMPTPSPDGGAASPSAARSKAGATAPLPAATPAAAPLLAEVPAAEKKTAGDQAADRLAADSRSGTRREDSRMHRCSLACRALTSMRRSANRLCELAGDADARCDDVRHRVERAALRVARACPAC
ncbi:MAG: hypothetical protein EXR75_07995 [Myxococcales bacterium]|nr:hypothetical protein [Myxococcales bacterium]